MRSSGRRGAKSKNQELASLKQQADSLNLKMKDVLSRVNRLENQFSIDTIFVEFMLQPAVK